MLELLTEKLKGGPVEASVVAIGGNVTVTLKVQIDAVDSVGMVCRVKGMLGGYGEQQLRPWACVASLSLS